jgi:hypothetical protein
MVKNITLQQFMSSQFSIDIVFVLYRFPSSVIMQLKTLFHHFVNNNAPKILNQDQRLFACHRFDSQSSPPTYPKGNFASARLTSSTNASLGSKSTGTITCLLNGINFFSTAAH